MRRSATFQGVLQPGKFLWMFACVLIVGALLAPTSNAETITIEDSELQSGFVGYTPAPFASSEVHMPPITALPFDFTGSEYWALRSITSLSITMTVLDGATAEGEPDYNDWTLVLDGIDTGILLNGFTGFHPEIEWRIPLDTLTIAGAPNLSGLILERLQEDGRLEARIYDRDDAFGEFREYNFIAIPDGRYVGQPISATLGLTGESTPEPATWLLLGVGLLGLGLLRKHAA